MQRHLDISTWEIFIAVAQSGSIASIADRFQMEPSNISRSLNQLERSLGNTKLFDRKQNRLQLSPLGKIVIEHARQMVSSHKKIQTIVSENERLLSGTIKVGMPQLLLEDFLLGPFIHFEEQFSNIHIKTGIYRGLPPTNFAKEDPPFDIIIGYGPDESLSSNQQFYVGSGPHIPIASPQYLKEHGIPQSIEDLKRHRLIILDNYFVNPKPRFLTDSGTDVSAAFGEVISFSSPSAATSATLLGAGIHYGTPSLYCYKRIVNRELVPIINLWENQRYKHYVFVRAESSAQKRVQLLAQYIVSNLKREYRTCRSQLTPYVPKNWLPKTDKN